MDGNDEVKVFDASKARKVLERVHNFLGILIRENLVKDAPFLNDVELENESDLADDVWEVLLGVPRNCDVGTAAEQHERFYNFCDKVEECKECPLWRGGGLTSKCCAHWGQMPYEEGGAK